MADSPRLEELRRRVQADPASIAFAALAEEYRRAGKFREAVDASRAGLRYHPTYVSARVTLGRSLVELQEVEQAERELVFVLKSAPDNLAARRALGELCWQQLRFGDALTHFRTAHALAPADAELPQILQSLERELAADRNGASPKPEEAKAEEAKPEAKAEGAKLEEDKLEEVKPTAKAEAIAEARVEAKAEATAESKAEAELKTQPEAVSADAGSADAGSADAAAKVAAVIAAAAPSAETPAAAAAEASAESAAATEDSSLPAQAEAAPVVDAIASAETLKLVRPEPAELPRVEEPPAEPQPAVAEVVDAPLAAAPPAESPVADAQSAGVDAVDAAAAFVEEADFEVEEAHVEGAHVEAVSVDAAADAAADAVAGVAADAVAGVAADAAVDAVADAAVDDAADAAQEEDTAEFAQFEPVAFVEHDEDHHHHDVHAREYERAGEGEREQGESEREPEQGEPAEQQGYADAATEIEYVQHVDAVEQHVAAAGTVGMNGQAHVVRVARPVPNPALVRLERFHRAILASRARRRTQASSSDSSNGQAPRL